jgi:hypothetical protein
MPRTEIDGHAQPFMGDMQAHLEAGGLVYFPHCPVPLPSGVDLEFLRSQGVQGAKSISYYPETAQLDGQRPAPAEETARLHALLATFNREAANWLGTVLPRYGATLRQGPLRFRTEEEAGRTDVDPRYSGSTLHVDMSSDAPARGESFLRLFVNLHPDQPRHWLTSDTLPQLLQRWRAQGDIPAGPAPGLAARLRLRHGHRLGLRPSTENPYHTLMSRLHFHGKTDPYLQEQATVTRWRFAPGSAWLVFSDLASHAVQGGRWAIDQTFFVPPWGFRDPACSTAAILERYWRGKADLRRATAS